MLDLVAVCPDLLRLQSTLVSQSHWLVSTLYLGQGNIKGELTSDTFTFQQMLLAAMQSWATATVGKEQPTVGAKQPTLGAK